MSVSLGMPLVRRDPSRIPLPDSRLLTDRFGRVATDLRVSLTDRCNLRCTYCMPEDGLPVAPTSALMTREELARLIRIAVTSLGVTQVRFTGGEPLLRPDLVDIVRDTASLSPRPQIALTTNAVGLASRARALAEAGLDRINISLDTVDAQRYRELTRRPFLRQALEGIEAARAAGLAPIKLNAVLQPSIGPEHLRELTAWALERGLELRFIEQMPLDANHAWRRERMVTAEDLRAALSVRYRLVAEQRAARGAAPAERYEVWDGPVRLGTVGVIASVTESFCAACNRTRLTADGRVRNCLFAAEEFDLLTALRDGADDRDLAELWMRAHVVKRAGHGIDEPGFAPPRRSMSKIGG